MKSVFIATLLLLCTAPVWGCDVCGCSIGGNYFGILPRFNQHFVGLRYQFRSFQSEHIPLFDEPSNLVSNEYYHTTELWGRWNPNPRIQVFGFLPYNHFEKQEEGVFTQVNSLGDASLIANVILFNNGDSTAFDWKQALQIGGGVKLPTGRYDLRQAEELLNRNLQPGTGSFDFPLNVIYTVRYKRAGLNAEINYRINTTNADHYRFGNRLSSALRLFYWQKVRMTSFVPSAGLQWEHAAADHENGVQQDFTGGKALWLNASVDVFYDRFSFGASWQQPVSQNLGDGQITARPRLNANVIVLF